MTRTLLATTAKLDEALHIVREQVSQTWQHVEMTTFAMLTGEIEHSNIFAVAARVDHLAAILADYDRLRAAATPPPSPKAPEPAPSS